MASDIYRAIPVYPEFIASRKTGVVDLGNRLAAEAPIMEEKRGKVVFYAYTSKEAKEKWLRRVRWERMGL